MLQEAEEARIAIEAVLTGESVLRDPWTHDSVLPPSESGYHVLAPCIKGRARCVEKAEIKYRCVWCAKAVCILCVS